MNAHLGTPILAAVAAVASLIACSEKRCPDIAPAASASSLLVVPSLPPSTASRTGVVQCSKFYKSIEAVTVRAARYEKTILPATPAEREAVAKIPPDEYGAYWLCIIDAKKADPKDKTWCECTRGSNRVFEDFNEKRDPVRWVSTE